ncbi:Vascular endothelial growth factor receptor 1 [Folsomia candida]|uniref:Vascular endothelial growth factor receptor 1 n=2 Tax=Folsomia candida TaxID=158441 RepID=A0A226EAM4_FOLCA|nr:Vascular endothelial growth factor receptor 1 [Folsomia candida]
MVFVGTLLLFVIGDLIFLHNLADADFVSKSLTVQYERVGLLIAMICINAIFYVSFEKNWLKLGLLGIPIYIPVAAVQMNLFVYNIVFRAPHPDTISQWMRIDSSLAGLFVARVSGNFLFNARYVWALRFAKKHKFRGMGETCTIFGLKVKRILQCQSMLVLPYTYFFYKNMVNLLSKNDPKSEGSSVLLVLSWISAAHQAVIIGTKISTLVALHLDSVRTLRIASWTGYITFAFLNELLIMKKVIGVNITGMTSPDSVYSQVFGGFIYLSVTVEYGLLYFYVTYLENLNRNCIQGNNNDTMKLTVLQLKSIVVDSSAMLGVGKSSTVYKGCLSDGRFFPSKQIVAVKVINRDTQVSALYDELKNMSRLMKIGHENLVTFYGIVKSKHTGSKTGDQPAKINIVMELCENGSLEVYLQHLEAAANNSLTNSRDIYVDQFVLWGTQIASGMEFLGNHGIVHGDLAARNVLLNDSLSIKISDFGMSYKLYNYQIYAVSDRQAFPWRWMAPESLDELKFSSQSDIWSYGVLLWEIFSFGKRPWPDHDWTSDFSTNLKNGLRLGKPEFGLGETEIYDSVMLNCWRTDANERIAFKEIVICMKMDKLKVLAKKCIEETREWDIRLD